MGISVGEVHARAKQAAAELEAEGIPAPTIPEPGGGGEPLSGAKSGEAPERGSPPPKAPKPTVPAEKQKGEPVVPIPHHEHGHGPKELAHEAKLLENRGLWAILAGVAIVVVFVIILLVSGGGGSDSNSTTTASSTSTDNCKTEAA